MTKPKLCDQCGLPLKGHVREGRIVYCVILIDNGVRTQKKQSAVEGK